MNISAVHPNAVDHFWPEISPYLQLALDAALDAPSLDEFRTGCKEGRYLALLVQDADAQLVAVLSMELIDTNVGKVANVVTAGGEQLDEWLAKLVDTISVLAREQGAVMLCMKGRKGWERKLRTQGWAHLYSVMGLPL